jgi:hypothetical protein
MILVFGLKVNNENNDPKKDRSSTGFLSMKGAWLAACLIFHSTCAKLPIWDPEFLQFSDAQVGGRAWGFIILLGSFETHLVS